MYTQIKTTLITNSRVRTVLITVSIQISSKTQLDIIYLNNLIVNVQQFKHN